MDSQLLKEKLIQKSKELQIDKIGFANCDPFLELKERLKERQAKDYHTSFEEPNIERRVNPSLSLNNAKSIVAIAISYSTKFKAPPKSYKDNFRGVFSRSSWGTDYHRVLKDRLDKLSQYLIGLCPQAKTEIMVDTGSLCDRAVAERAGLGFSGKNTSIINGELGSWIYLGEFITDVFIPPDENALDSCGDCTKCIDACPTGAIKDSGILNAKECLSYISQTKSIIEEKFRYKLGNRLYGCDTCQTVCPKNKKINFTHQDDFRPDNDKVKPLLKPLLDLSNREFKNRFGDMSGSWRGKAPIQRNAIIGLAHFKDESSIPKLIDILKNDNRYVMRAISAWALKEIGGSRVNDVLKSALSKETNAEVVSEISRAINKDS